MTDARDCLRKLIDVPIRTWRGDVNTVLAIEGDKVLVATKKAPRGELVPIEWVQRGLDQLDSDGPIAPG